VSVPLFLTVLSGLAWTIVYLEAIRLGFRHRTYAMPMAALALNIAWESLYAAHAWATALSVQGVINTIWALLDLAIVSTFLRFGRRELPAFVTRPLFLAWAALLFGSSYIVQGMFVVQFGWGAAARYSAFLQNLLMSGLFIAMFVARRGGRGQSLVIAVAKWLGTLAPTILFGVYAPSPFILALGSLCSVFDLVYVGLLGWATRHPVTLAETAPETWVATACSPSTSP
jgi:hypothetical protein